MDYHNSIQPRHLGTCFICGKRTPNNDLDFISLPPGNGKGLVIGSQSKLACSKCRTFHNITTKEPS